MTASSQKGLWPLRGSRAWPLAAGARPWAQRAGTRWGRGGGGECKLKGNQKPPEGCGEEKGDSESEERRKSRGGLETLLPQTAKFLAAGAGGGGGPQPLHPSQDPSPQALRGPCPSATDTALTWPLQLLQPQFPYLENGVTGLTSPGGREA